MKRVKAFVGSALVILVFTLLLVLELGFVAMLVAAVVGMVEFVRLPISPGETLQNFLRGVLVILIGAVAGIATVLAVLWPYQCVTGWRSTARQSPGPVA